jgi:hypothetical protein
MRRHGGEPQMDVMLDGFNDRYEDEVVRRWGRDAFEVSHQWWHAKTVREQREWKASAEALLERWRELQESGHEVDAPVVRDHVRVHMAWFADIPGTPTYDGDTERSAAMILGVAEEYERNPDFHRSFGTEAAARFAAAALRDHVERPA